ncbi:RNA helicase, partial [Fusarium globosum]
MQRFRLPINNILQHPRQLLPLTTLFASQPITPFPSFLMDGGSRRRGGRGGNRRGFSSRGGGRGGGRSNQPRNPQIKTENESPDVEMASPSPAPAPAPPLT